MKGGNKKRKGQRRRERNIFSAFNLKKIMHLSFNPAMEDNFFSLGGHSLLITAIIIEIRKSYACQIKPREIYSAKTLPAYAVD